MFRVYASDNFPMVKKVTTVQNQADPAFEGKYTLTIQENQVTVEQNEFNGTAKCDPADSFDLGESVKIAMGKLLEAKDKAKKEAEAKVIKVGDLVKIVNNEKTCTTYPKWLIDNKLSIGVMCRYAYGDTPSNGLIGTVLKIAPHKNSYYRYPFALIESDDSLHTCYLIGVEGLEKVTK